MTYDHVLTKLRAISFLKFVSKEIFHPVSYGDLDCNLCCVKGDMDFISLGLKKLNDFDSLTHCSLKKQTSYA